MSAEDIIIERRERVGWVEINRPEASNALRTQTMMEICAALDTFEADESIGAIVVAGRGKHFAAGGDYAFLQSLLDTPTVDVRDTLYAHFQGVTRRLYQSAKPTLAAVSGAAITVGAEIALACDFRIATESARFDEGWIRIGLMPALGGAMLLPRIVGLAMAKEMILGGRVLRGTEALAAGLVGEIVDPDVLWERAQERAMELAALPRHAYRASKEAIHRGMESSMESEWAASVMGQSILLSSADFAESLASRTEAGS